jgi:hypothetical protein
MIPPLRIGKDRPAREEGVVVKKIKVEKILATATAIEY